MKKQQYRICLFLPSLCGGGAERVMVNLASGFADQDIKVDLVLAKAEGLIFTSAYNAVIDLKASSNCQPSWSVRYCVKNIPKRFYLL